MKKIILANGVELDLHEITGMKRDVQGAYRDVLGFVFENASLDELDGIFTESACETITVVEGEDEYIHRGYTIRVGLEKKNVVANGETPDAEAEVVSRITVSMAQRTYAETKLAQVADEITSTQLALVELYEGVM